MRRLFSSFARGAPGIGLLLLRVATGSALIYCGAAGLLAPPHVPSTPWRALLVLLGLMLFAGLWTPVVALLAVVATVWEVVSAPTAWPQSPSIAVMAAALTLLGPGAWSVDAWLYGWKQIRIPARHAGQDPSD